MPLATHLSEAHIHLCPPCGFLRLPELPAPPFLELLVALLILDFETQTLGDIAMM